MKQAKTQNPFVELLLWPIRGILFLLKVVSFAVFIIAGWYIIQLTGILPVQVPVTGASMLPTLPEDGFVSFQRYVHVPSLEGVLPLKIHRGDIVVFENAKTDEELQKQNEEATGFVKRVVGVAGDTVAIRNGFVYVNDKSVEEPYILKSRSTFGGTEIRDCQAVTVPTDHVFVMGDNRKVSLDSRHIGLVSLDDIDYFIPYDKQTERFADKWRDASHDSETAELSLFNTADYVRLLNNERAKHNLAALTFEPKLEQTAQIRAEVMLRNDDFSFEGEKSGYTMVDAMRDVGYNNIAYGEFPMIGYYDTQELFDAFLEQPNAKKFLLNENYDEIGVSTFVGQLNGCPTQVVVQHLAGYLPPDYSASEINSWQQGLTKLREIQPGWQKLTTYEEFYRNNKTDVDRLNEIINIRIQRMSAIVSRMQDNEWLTTEEKRWMSEDSGLAQEQNSLADKLNDAQ
ncbi:MAG: signal peptidase I [Weeksellaceae bacterium]